MPPSAWVLASSVAYIGLCLLAYVHVGWNRATTLGLLLQIVVLLPAYLYGVQRASGRRQAPFATQSLAPVLLAFFLVAAPGAWFWGQGQLIPDEGTYSFMARILSGGSLSVPSPTVVLPTDPESQAAAGFIHTIHHHGRWFGKYPPGWPAVLALTDFAGVGWLASVLCAGLLVWITFRLGSEMYSAETGWLSACILASSPLFFFNVMGRMPHALCGALVVTAALFGWRHLRTERLAPFVAMLVLIALGSQVRPYTSFVVGGLLGTFCFWSCRDKPGLLVGMLGAVILTGGTALIITGLYNRSLTEHPLLSPYALYHNRSFVPVELVPSLEVLVHNICNRLRWSTTNELFFTTVPVLAAALFAVFTDKARRREAIGVSILALSLIVAHIPTTIPPGGRWGDRFHFESLFAYSLLAGRGLDLATARLPAPFCRVLLVCFLSIQGLHIGLYYPPLRQATGTVAQLRAAAARLPERRSVVFIASVDDPDFLATHWNPNDAQWSSATHVFLVDPGANRRLAIRCALERPAAFLMTWHGKDRSVQTRELPSLTGECHATG